LNQVPANLIYCPIRKINVAALPEEIIRQKLIACMTQQLGFPLSYLAVEKELRQMPHLKLVNNKVPQRRADLICFSKEIHPQHSLYPLLIVECKAVKLTLKVARQVAGYNHFVGAYFVAIANESDVKTGWYDSVRKEYIFVDYLPSYDQLRAEALKQNLR